MTAKSFCSLDDIAEILDSRRIPLNSSERQARLGKFPYYGANGQVGTVDDFLFEGEHILLAEDGGYFDDPRRPNAYLVSGQFWVNNHAHILRAGPNVLNGYLLHALNAINLMPFTSGTTRLKLTQASLRRITIPLPPLDEQRRIVGLLDRAAEIRRRADAARAKARAIIPALFLDTFGDPATNPKGWPVMTLGDTIISGPQNGLYKPATDYGSGVRILRIDSFDDGTIANQGALKRLRLDRETTDKFKLSEGDIVVNRVNSPPQLGKSVLIPRLEEPVVFESNMMRMRVNPDLLLPPVLGVMLQLNSIRQALIKNAKHAINQSSINQGDVTGITVFAPPIQLQSVFAEHIQRIDAVARHLDAAAAKAEAMAAGLSAEVFDAGQRKDAADGSLAPC